MKPVPQANAEITKFYQNAPKPPINNLEWWQKFADPTLKKLVSDAQNENLSVQLAKTRIEQARLQNRSVIGGNIPSIKANGSLDTTTALHGTQLLDAKTYQYDRDFQASNTDSIAISWEVPLFGKAASSIIGAQANEENAIFSYDAAKIAMISDICDAYFQLRTAQVSKKYLEEDLERANLLKKISDDRLRVGLVSQTDNAIAGSNANNIEQQINDTNINIRSALNRIAILRGTEAGSLDNSLNNIDNFSFPANTPKVEEVPADFVRRRLDVKQAEMQAILQSANIGTSYASLYPKVSINGAISLMAAIAGNPIGSSISRATSSSGISFPLFDYGQTKANYKLANVQFDQAMINYKSAVLNAISEGQLAIGSYNEGQKRAKSAIEAENYANIRLKASKKSFDVGLISTKDYVDAQRDYAAARIKRLQAQSTLSSASVGLYRTFAGSPEIVK